MLTSMQNESYLVYTAGDTMTALRHPGDPYAMNWVAGKTPWGTAITPEGIGCTISRRFANNGTLLERYTFTNNSPTAIYTTLRDIAIHTPLTDRYQNGEASLTGHCHAHVWCGGTSSTIMALRMGGKGPHLGLVLIEGALDAYSIEREEADPHTRGGILLHPAPAQLEPGESFSISWELFWHTGQDDFYARAARYPLHIPLTADRFVLFEGESATLNTRLPTGAEVRHGGHALTVQPGGHIQFTPEATGEARITITGNGHNTFCHLHCLPSLFELTATRCHFIAKNQQVDKPGSSLHGAYLHYNNADGHPIYNGTSGLGSVSMAILFAAYLQTTPDKVLEQSLCEYFAYLLRELWDDTTNTIRPLPGLKIADRLTGYNWLTLFFMECYRLNGDDAWLARMTGAIRSFYAEDAGVGHHISLPVLESTLLLRAMGHPDTETLVAAHIAHAERLLAHGFAFEAGGIPFGYTPVVNTTVLLLQMYILTGELSYLLSSQGYLQLLDLFNGLQPSAYLHGSPLRYSEGAILGGVGGTYGDAFPQGLGVLTGCTYRLYYIATHDERYRRLAKFSFRAPLTLFEPDGSAHGARFAPLTINGKRAQGFSPLATDQDWALYHAYKNWDSSV